ncbi:MAG: 4Fe-4S binding protein [Desulfobacula sp.]|jgi:ferredoxin|uniref:indolepyruvate ferredoxin oxidoreductase subunit alpha n=1 Tax=Desulfobacula sp. TaxID=2593537 RepID=UPI001D448C9B|nr:4Fe-4S binding protein [Desulfobacula sp.]MBT3485792.1 4Fe-4S binding protein [Desulfobacula sp.]MBT3803416.1 4Fe-4S binding protein [Desulfobacula sp.]MBT4024337.1 4Fe-4S binding protein [Desulfobacula sp.]MBT4199648.1 4Fe-4S binding protein [Desulfobacula sp.]
MSFFKVNENCNGCLACVKNCPASALNYFDQKDSRKIMHNMSLCARCGHCWRICPQDAIEFKVLLAGKFDLVKTLDLVHCRVCGEPIYTASLGETVSNDIQNSIEPLCPDHKGSEPINVWKKLASKRTSQ